MFFYFWYTIVLTGLVIQHIADTHTHAEAHALMAKECLERSHLETLKYTPPHLYFRHMHSRLRCSVKVNWAVETKELGTTLGEFYAHRQCRVVKKSFYFGSHIHHMSEKQRGSVLKTAASHHSQSFFSYTVQWLFGAEPTSSFTGNTGIQTFQVVW